VSETAGSLFFEGFRLAPAGLSRVDGSGVCEPVPLGLRSLDLLLLLAQRPGEVVPKDTIIETVWRGAAVEESNLTVQISTLRRILDRDRKQGSCIQTVPGRGYRFAASISRSSPAAQEPAVPALPDMPSIAVMPFQNISGDPEQDYFVDGMVEEITTAIARFHWLSVIARNSAFAYKGKAVDVRQVARELGVRYVLEGSVRKAGTRVRITGQLIDAASGNHIWADRFDGALDDIFDLQDQVAASVVGAIEPRLRRAEIERARRKPAGSLDAYDFYLRAMAEGYKRTRQGYADSVRLAQQALELDPAYVPAMAQIATFRLMQVARGWIPAESPEAEEGIRLARQAIAEKRDDSNILQAAGYALGFLVGDNETALSALDRAIELNPYHALAFGQRALVLSWLGRNDEAIQSAEKAIRLSPHHSQAHAFYTALAVAHMGEGRYEEALLWADRSVRENSGAVGLRTKICLLGHLGRLEEAKETLRLLREIHPEPTVAGMMRELPRSFSPAAHFAEGLRNAGLPEG
jgi:TolB-like protein